MAALDNISTLTVIGGFFVHLGCLIAGGTWALSQLKASVIAALTEHQKEVDAEFAAARREFGETGAAIRQKIHEIELHAEQTFVRRDGFYKVRDDLADSIKTLGDKIDKRLDRMEEKIDSKT